ncbi:MAG: OmpA family protein [Nitrospira sp.]|nr:OmpA family protein [Nitrospira sp.]
MRPSFTFEAEPFGAFGEEGELERSRVRRPAVRRRPLKIRPPTAKTPKRPWPSKLPTLPGRRPPVMVFPPPFRGVRTPPWPPAEDQPSTEPASPTPEPTSSAGGTGGDTAASAPAETCRPPTVLHNFGAGSAQLQPGHHATLARLADSLKRSPASDLVLTIEGHTDGSPGEGSRRSLALQRALAVAKFLADRGLDIETVTRSFHGSQPVASDATAEGRQRNRRVAIRICQRQ